MSVKSIKYNDICDCCAHVGYCVMAQFGGHNPRITACSHFTSSKQTNGDRIRSMTDDELVNFLWQRDIKIVEKASKVAGFSYSYDEAECKQNIKCWLKSPMEANL